MNIIGIGGIGRQWNYPPTNDKGNNFRNSIKYKDSVVILKLLICREWVKGHNRCLPSF